MLPSELHQDGASRVKFNAFKNHGHKSKKGNPLIVKPQWARQKRGHVVEFLTTEKLNHNTFLVCAREKRNIREKEARSKMLTLLSSSSSGYTLPASHLTYSSSDSQERLWESAFPLGPRPLLIHFGIALTPQSVHSLYRNLINHFHLFKPMKCFYKKLAYCF